MKYRPGTKDKCAKCGAEYTVVTVNQRYCCAKCRTSAVYKAYAQRRKALVQAARAAGLEPVEAAE